MRSSFAKQVPTLILVILAVFTLVPAAAAAPREREPRSVRERVVRLIQTVAHKFGVSANSDSIVIPKP